MPKKYSEMIEGYVKPKKIFLKGYQSQVEAGCRLLGIPTQSFYEKDILKLVKSGEMTPFTPVKGTVRCVRTYFHHVGIKQPKNVDIPEELRTMKFCGRKFYDRMTLGKIRRMPEKERSKLFIKARDIQKAWNGSNADDGLLQNTGLFPDNTPLFCCDYKENFNENYSCHVREGKIITNVDKNIETFIKQATKAWSKNVHSAYRIDIGELNGKPVITELNEVWSSGRSIKTKPTQNWEDLHYYDPNNWKKNGTMKTTLKLSCFFWHVGRILN
jgi:hypothetical protein